MTAALGPVPLHRPYLWHPTESGRFPANELLGLEGFLTRHARQRITRAGIEHSVARAQQVLAESCGWEVNDEVIRQTTHAEARRVAAQRPERKGAVPFAEAAGGIDALIDAGEGEHAHRVAGCQIRPVLEEEAGLRRHAPRVGSTRSAVAAGPCGDCRRRRSRVVRGASAPGIGSVGGDRSARGDGAGRWGRMDAVEGAIKQVLNLRMKRTGAR